MDRTGWLQKGFGLLLFVAALLVACGGDSAASGGGSGGGSGSGGDGDGDGDGSGETLFTGALLDNLNEQPVPGITVKALDNASGEELGMEATSSSPTGEVQFEGLPEGSVGFVAVGTPGDSIDTFQFNIDSNAKDETLWMVSKTVATLVPGLADYEPDPVNASVAGALYWVSASGVEEPVGCATIAFGAEEGDVRYFGDNNLPTRDTPHPDDAAAEYRTDSNPLNGRFFIGNAPTGKQTIRMLVDGEEVGATELVLFAGEDSSDGEDSVCISNIYVEGLDKNPTPEDCE